MGEKSANKRNYILDVARDIFAEKGYIAATMRDVVEKCAISRGGVYLYFDNVKDLFEAVMVRELDGEAEFGKNIPDNANYTDVLKLFIKEQKKVILSKKPNLTAAIYEYYFENKVPAKENLLKQDFEASLYVLTELITNGIDAGEFYDIDAKRAAGNLMYLLEGLKIVAKTSGLTEKAVDEEIDYMLQGIIAEEE